MSRRGENIYKRKDGRWEGRYKNGYKANGNIRYSSVYGKTYGEVKAVLSKKRNIVSDKTIPDSLTINNLFDLWLNSIRISVKESSFANYMMKCDKHILPTLGNIPYKSLTAERLNDFIREKLSAGLSPKYVSDIAGLIKAACRFIHKKYGYADNSELMVLPKAYSDEKPLLNKQEQITLNAYLTSNPVPTNIGIALAASTGIRIGELCALQWSDIDLEKRTITVKNTVQRVKALSGEKATKLIITEPKSRKSLREIPLPDHIVPFLEGIKCDNAYVLSGNEKMVEPRTMQYRFKSILKRLNLKNVTFHCLRHIFASNCIAIGFDIKTLSEILGHSSVEITLNRYVHSSMDRKRECMSLFSQHYIKAEKDINRQKSCQLSSPITVI